MGKLHARSQIIKKLSGKIVQMSQHKYASNVVEKCLEHGDTTERELLIEEIIGQSEENDTLLVNLFFFFWPRVNQLKSSRCRKLKSFVITWYLKIDYYPQSWYSYLVLWLGLTFRLDSLWSADPSQSILASTVSQGLTVKYGSNSRLFYFIFW